MSDRTRIALLAIMFPVGVVACFVATIAFLIWWCTLDPTNFNCIM